MPDRPLRTVTEEEQAQFPAARSPRLREVIDESPMAEIVGSALDLIRACGNVTLTHPRRSHASMWAGPDVRYINRRGQVVPDPAALYPHRPRNGQPLGDFPDVFPVVWSPQ